MSFFSYAFGRDPYSRSTKRVASPSSIRARYRLVFSGVPAARVFYQKGRDNYCCENLHNQTKETKWIANRTV